MALVIANVERFVEMLGILELIPEFKIRFDPIN